MVQNIAGQVYNRLTEGDYVPLTDTPPHRYGKGWFIVPGAIATLIAMSWVSATYPDSEFLAYFMSLLIMVAVGCGFVMVVRNVLPSAVRGTVAVQRAGKHATRSTGRFAQDRGWPSWTDAWGTKGMRPGGPVRGLMRGYLRVFVVAASLAVLALPLDGGAGLVMVSLIGGPIALLVAVLLWHCRVIDFDQVKGWAVFAFLWVAIDRLPWSPPRQPRPPRDPRDFSIAPRL